MPACRPGCRAAPRCSTQHTARGALADQDALAVELRTPIGQSSVSPSPRSRTPHPRLRHLPDVVLTRASRNRPAESSRGCARLPWTGSCGWLRGCPSPTRWSTTRCTRRTRSGSALRRRYSRAAVGTRLPAGTISAGVYSATGIASARAPPSRHGWPARRRPRSGAPRPWPPCAPRHATATSGPVPASTRGRPRSVSQSASQPASQPGCRPWRGAARARAEAEAEVPQRWLRLDLSARLRAGADVAREEPVGQGPAMAATTTGRPPPSGSFTGPPRAVRAW